MLRCQATYNQSASSNHALLITMGVFFGGESKNGDVIQIIWILHYQKNGRSQKGSFTLTTASPRAPRGKKIQQTDPYGKDKKKTQHKLPMNIRNVYISV